MKRVRDLALASILCAVAMSAAKAANDSTSADSSPNPVTQADVDGVPLTVNQPQKHQPSQAELDAQQRLQQKATQDKDWLLRGYEEQMQMHSTTTDSTTGNANLFYQLSTDRELSKLAGISPQETGDSPQLAFRTGTVGTGLSLRTDTSQQRNQLGENLSKPLMSQLGITNPIGMHNFYSTPSSVAPSTFLPSNNPAPRTATAAVASQPHDPLAMQTPGQIAAEQNPNLYPAGMDPNVETLPGETLEQAQRRLIISPVMELSMPLEVKQPLRAKPVGAMTVADAPKKAVPLAPAVVLDLNAPTPVSKMPAQNPIRAPISDPFDIFYR